MDETLDSTVLVAVVEEADVLDPVEVLVLLLPVGDVEVQVTSETDSAVDELVDGTALENVL